MKQLTQVYRTGKLTVVDSPPPLVRPGGVLVRNAASVISPGTERALLEMGRKSLVGKARERPDQVRRLLDKARREGIGPAVEGGLARLNTPVPLGYSSAGVVMEVGEGVAEFQPGDRVACGGAGFAVHAEVVSVPRNLVVRVPEASLEEAAFTTIGAIALQGVRIADVRIGESVAVIGLGLVGLLTVQLLKAAGCRVLGLDLNQSRSEMARQLGAELAFVGGRSAASRREVSQAAQAFTEGHGFDAVLITAATSSNEPVELAGQIARDRGRIVAVGTVGTVIPRQLYYEKELDFRISRSYGPGRYDAEYEEKGHDYPVGYVRWTENRNMQAFVQLLADGKVAVDPLITHHFPIEEASKAYDLITGYADTLGVVLTYGAHVEEERRRQTQEGAAPVAAQPSRGIAAESRESKARPIPITALGSGISIGVIGAGDFAKSVLLPGLKALPGVRLAAICSATGLSAQHAAKRFGIAACASDADAVLDDPAINAVVIATRHNLHASLAIRALQRGKHVFVEKPLALNEEELRAVVEASSAAPSTLLMVGYNRRFAPATREMLRFLGPRTGPLAVHYRVNAGYLPPEHWMHDLEEGGGRIVGELCHFVDWMQYVIGAPPVKVSAQALPGDGRYPAEDNVVVALSFADGSLGTIHYLANGDPREMKEYFELFCDGGVAVIEDFRTGRLRRNGRTRSLGRRLWAKQDKGHTAELQAFAAALRDGRASPVPLQEVVVGALATYKIREALRTGVSLGIHPEEVGVPPQEPPLARA